MAEDAAATAVTVTGMLDGAPRADETVVYVTVSAGTAGAGEFTPVTAFALSVPAGLRMGTAQFEFAPVDDKVDEDARRRWWSTASPWRRGSRWCP